MPDVHVPKIEQQGRSHILKLLLEVALISVGVFLGLMGEQWRESRHHHELAEQALRRFRTEIEANRKAVVDVKDYHVALQKQLTAYLAAKPDARRGTPVRMLGIRPAGIEQTAWDLAMATQALTYIDEHLAYSLSRLHMVQSEYQELTQGVLQAMYARPPTENRDVFFGALSIYCGDITEVEPRLLEMYDAAIKDIDRALGPG